MADLRLEIRTLSGGLLLEAKLPHGATGAQLHELVNATATLATEWRLVHRGSELELQQPLAAEDGETIFAAAKPHATEETTPWAVRSMPCPRDTRSWLLHFRLENTLGLPSEARRSRSWCAR
ncbi:unnamed protein product [Effrenium voratum]|uniref:Uncharacterized protein n=1 Tax=Effrenium voratum TaxID=2562239 RepID=A0AA36IWT3_9DINO|nr:unnamed protein product [Effrenium voratum]